MPQYVLKVDNIFVIVIHSVARFVTMSAITNYCCHVSFMKRLISFLLKSIVSI